MLIINNKTMKVEFIRRQNRFKGYVYIDGVETFVHVPNTGRCREILVPGCSVVLREENNPSRKTGYDLIAGYKGDMLINIDSHIPNKVVEEALRNGKIEPLKEYTIIEREKTFGSSRFDFKLNNGRGKEYYLEIKGVTYEKGGLTKFPDAPTDRGRRHLLELAHAVSLGYRAGVLFLIQMEGARCFTPHDEMDKAFGEALRYAYNNGVDVFAYDCSVREDLIELNKPVRILL